MGKEKKKVERWKRFGRYGMGGKDGNTREINDDEDKKYGKKNVVSEDGKGGRDSIPCKPIPGLSPLSS